MTGEHDAPAGAAPDQVRRISGVPAVRRGDAMILLVMGIVLAVAGAAFTVGLFIFGLVRGYAIDRIAGLAMLPLGLWVAAAGRARLREAARRASLSGVATATVTAIEVSRSWANEYPRCRIRFSVEVPGHPAYPAEIDTTVPPYDVPHYQPGDRLTAWADPIDPGQIAIVDDWDGEGGRRAELLASGVPGTAKVSRVFDAPSALGSKTPRLGLALRVALAGGRPGYEAEVAVAVPLATRSPRRGDRLAVRADPDDQRLIVIDWDSSPFSRDPNPSAPGR